MVILPLQLLVVIGGRPSLQVNEIAVGLFTIYRPTELWVGAYSFVISKEMTRRMKRRRIWKTHNRILYSNYTKVE